MNNFTIIHRELFEKIIGKAEYIGKFPMSLDTSDMETPDTFPNQEDLFWGELDVLNADKKYGTDDLPKRSTQKALCIGTPFGSIVVVHVKSDRFQCWMPSVLARLCSYTTEVDFDAVAIWLGLEPENYREDFLENIGAEMRQQLQEQK